MLFTDHYISGLVFWKQALYLFPNAPAHGFFRIIGFALNDILIPAIGDLDPVFAMKEDWTSQNNTSDAGIDLSFIFPQLKDHLPEWDKAVTTVFVSKNFPGHIDGQESMAGEEANTANRIQRAF